MAVHLTLQYIAFAVFLWVWTRPQVLRVLAAFLGKALSDEQVATQQFVACFLVGGGICCEIVGHIKDTQTKQLCYAGIIVAACMVAAFNPRIFAKPEYKPLRTPTTDQPDKEEVDEGLAGQ